ncbi:MAG: YncE family protein, partial [Dermatophilaceae bacterium]
MTSLTATSQIIIKPLGTLSTGNPQNPEWPQIIHEAALSTPPNSTSLPAWTDLSSRVQSLSTTRGRTWELATPAPGSGMITLGNADGAFDPTNTSSPYSPNVQPMRLFRTRVAWAGKMYEAARSLIRRWPQSWETSRYGIVRAQTVDMLGTLGSILWPVATLRLSQGAPDHCWPLDENLTVGPYGTAVTWQWSDIIGVATLSATWTPTSTQTNGTVQTGQPSPARADGALAADTSQGFVVGVPSGSTATIPVSTTLTGTDYVWPQSGQAITWAVWWSDSLHYDISTLGANTILSLTDGTIVWAAVTYTYSSGGSPLTMSLTLKDGTNTQVLGLGQVNTNTAGLAHLLVVTAGDLTAATPFVMATITVGTGPIGVAVTPNGSYVYVANGGAGTVSVIATATNTVTATITVGTSPIDVAVTPNGSYVYVANSGGGTVSVIATATNTVTAT